LEAPYQVGKRTLESFGFHLKEGRTIYLQRWWSAGTPEEQASDMNEMFADPDIRGIVALAGGFSAIHVLDLLDYDLIRRNPKPFIGMSDNTFYQLAMYSQCGLVGFHGNTLTEGFGAFYEQAPLAHQAVIADLYVRLLTVPQPLGPIPQLTDWACWRSGMAEGKLLGGTLRRLTGLLGTKYFPPLSEFEGAILFWEEIGETLYDITLNLKRLKHAGILERIGGMVIGKLVWVNQYFDEIEHPTPQEAILDVLSDYAFPILAEVDFSHRQTMIPLPIGIMARMDSERQQLALIEAAVC
jgi:muramoyltetrapeptide carboxypeptidase